MSYSKIDNEIENTFKEKTIGVHYENNNMRMISEDFDQAGTIISIGKLVDRIIKSEQLSFFVKDGSNTIDCTDQKILQSLRLYIVRNHLVKRIKYSFPIHRFNPYVELFTKNFTEKLVYQMDLYFNPITADNCCYDKTVKVVDMLNVFVEEIKSKTTSLEFKNILNEYKDRSEKNYNNFLKYNDSIFARHARVLTIRVDFSYRRNIALYPVETQIYEDYCQAKKDHARFCNNMRSNKIFQHLIGNAWRLEYTTMTGFHFHEIFYFDGSKVREDMTIGQLIGEYWAENITGGRGRYFNCNANKDGYKHLGIGMINADDVTLRTGLEITAAYLFKPDIYAKIDVPYIARTYGRGVLKTLPETKRGRPRQKHEYLLHQA
ncbi:MAG TPA: inovirus-type Gp2 protein [Methylobacter sp.]|jgi:galactitol-specific phosphotransferase system IIB component